MLISRTPTNKKLAGVVERFWIMNNTDAGGDETADRVMNLRALWWDAASDLRERLCRTKDSHAKLELLESEVEFFQIALGGTVIERVVDNEGRIVHAKLALGQFAISIMEEIPEWGWLSPEQLGGSPVLIQLDLENCDLVAERMKAHGAKTVVPIKDRAYGKREGRLCDPFGHLWILSQEIAA